MNSPIRFARAATAAVEIAHHGIDGTLHGHTLYVTAITENDIDLDRLKAELVAVLEPLEHGTLEEKVGRTFEDVATYIMTILPDVHTVRIALPSRGHQIEAQRTEP